MINKILLLSVLVLYSYRLIAGDPPSATSVRLQIYDRSSQGVVSEKIPLWIGAAEDASTCLDSIYEEREIPLFPPSGLFPVLAFPEDECEGIIGGILRSQRDIRNLPEADTTIAFRFEIEIRRDVNRQVIVQWPKLSPNITKAEIKNSPSGSFINVDMLTSDSILVGGVGTVYLAVDMEITTNLTSVAESDIEERSKIYPNPSTRHAVIDAPTGANISITDVLGNTYYTTRVEGGQVRLDLLQLHMFSGVYFVRIASNRTVSVKTLIVE
jgi:hypothetical protein